MKTYNVKLERTVTETATISVEARDKKTAAFIAAGQVYQWVAGNTTPLKIVAIDVAPQPELPIAKTETTSDYGGVIGIDEAKPKKAKAG